MDNATILVIVGIVIVIVVARKWDSFKWILGVAFTGLIIYTVVKMGMVDQYIPDIKTPTVDFK